MSTKEKEKEANEYLHLSSSRLTPAHGGGRGKRSRLLEGRADSPALGVGRQ